MNIESLIEQHSGFIRKMAHKYGNENNKDDLYQEGVIGLMSAAKRFDEKHKVKFLTYASYWIFKRMVLFLKSENRIIPVDLEKYNVSENDYQDPWSSMETAVEASSVTARARSEMISKDITERDIDIMMSRYLTSDPETLQTLATKYNISRERVRQIETKWTTFLKKRLQL